MLLFLCLKKKIKISGSKARSTESVPGKRNAIYKKKKHMTDKSPFAHPAGDIWRFLHTTLLAALFPNYCAAMSPGAKYPSWATNPP